MKSKWSVMKSVVVAVALVAGVAGVARADDSSMSRFGGDGYAYFHEDKPVVSRAQSEFRMEDPHGLTESQYQSLSSEGPEWQPQASIDKTLPSFRKTDPHGLSISEYQACHPTIRCGKCRERRRQAWPARRTRLSPTMRSGKCRPRDSHDPRNNQEAGALGRGGFGPKALAVSR